MATILDTIRQLEPQMVNANSITENRLRELVNRRACAKIATIITRTIPAMRKTRNPFYGDCFKIAKSNVVINPSDSGYEDSVNRQRLRELVPPTFEAEPRLWGTKLTRQPFIAHVNKVGELKDYLWVKVEKTVWVRYANSEGIFLDADEVESYIAESAASKRQGVNKEVKVRNYTLENVMGVYLDGDKFVVTH